MTKPTANTPEVAADVAKPCFIEIFRAGRHVDAKGEVATFTESDIRDIAESYDASASEAPIVVGHPEHNAPAYGWVRGLKAEGPLLLADVHQVDPEFAELVNAGRFKKRSAALLSPDAANHPKPGHWYLRHVGFLGGAAPAVKGLRDHAFADKGEGVHEFGDPETRWVWSAIADLFSRLRDREIERDGIEKADQVIGEWAINTIRDAARPEREAANPYFADAPSADDTLETDMSDRTAEFAARETEINKLKQEVTDREAALAKRESEARRSDAVAFVDGAAKEGKLLPRFKAPVVELLMSLGAATKLEFADGDKQVSKGADEILRELITDMPKRVDFTERGGDGNTFDFNDPNAIANAALEFQASEAKAGREISAAAAVRHITKGN